MSQVINAFVHKHCRKYEDANCSINFSFLFYFKFVGIEGFVTAIVDLFPKQLRRGYRKEMFIAFMCSIWFLIGLSMVTKVPLKALNKKLIFWCHSFEELTHEQVINFSVVGCSFLRPQGDLRLFG